MSVDPASMAVLCDLFESTLGVAVEPRQLLAVAQFVEASTGPEAMLHSRRERWTEMGARVVHDLAVSEERMMRTAEDLDAHWVASRSMPGPERRQWRRVNDFNIGEYP